MGNKKNVKKRKNPKTAHPATPSPKPAPKSAATVKFKKSPAYFAEKGSVEILSADNVLFKVEAYYLQSHSSVFRDLIENATADRIELFDHDIEEAQCLTDLFDVIIKDEVVITSQRRVRTARVIGLCRKYDFSFVLRKIGLYCRYQLTQAKDISDSAFEAGLAMDDLELCKLALQNEAYIWLKRLEGSVESFGENYTGGSVLDPAALSIEQFEDIPAKTLWAWIRAHRTAYPCVPVHGDHAKCREVMSNEFERLMKLPGAPKSLSSD